MMTGRSTWLLVAIWIFAGCAGSYDVPVQFEPATEMRLASKATTTIGVAEGPEDYLLDDVAGAALLEDGSVVVAVRAASEIRRYDSFGRHLWSVGRRGEGPGEFGSPQVPPGCVGDRRIFVYDWENRRITVLDVSGQVLSTWPLSRAATSISCSPQGRVVFTNYGRTPKVAGPYRSPQPLYSWDVSHTAPVLVRDGIPGADRWVYIQEGLEPVSGPRPLGKEIVLAATDKGVWLSTADTYEIEFIAWSGRTTRVVRWKGPGLGVTPEHIEARRNRYFSYNLERSDEPGWKKLIEEAWVGERSRLPDMFPSVRRILLARNGGVWVQHYYRAGDPNVVWVYLDDSGKWTQTLRLPPGRRIMDIGANWALVRIADQVGRQRLYVYETVQMGTDG